MAQKYETMAEVNRVAATVQTEGKTARNDLLQFNLTFHPHTLDFLNPAYREFHPSAYDPNIWEREAAATPSGQAETLVLLVSGPTASGKNTFLSEIEKARPELFAKVTT